MKLNYINDWNHISVGIYDIHAYEGNQEMTTIYNLKICRIFTYIYFNFLIIIF